MKARTVASARELPGLKVKPNTALVSLRQKLGWSQRDMAYVLNCTERAVSNWESGQKISHVFAARLNELKRLYTELARVMNPDYIGTWLKTEIPEYDQQSPADLIRKGQTDRLWSSIFFLKSGTPA